MKRIIDLLVSVILLVALLPVLGIIALLLLASDGRPIIFRQLRIGLGERPFTLYKFRTMREGVKAPVHDRPVARRHDEPHITPLGGILRRSKLDELPQLCNVIRGDMSLVGPRPLPAEDLLPGEWLKKLSEEERLRREEWRSQRHMVLPGITGSWQISAAPEEDFDNWINCDLYYLQHRSCWLDFSILLRTPFALLQGRRKLPPASGQAPTNKV